MKKIATLFLLLFSLFSFSQNDQQECFIRKTEKISFADYDLFKYVKSIDPAFEYKEDIVNCYQNNQLSFSLQQNTVGTSKIAYFLTPSRTLQYTITDANITRRGVVMQIGNDKYFSIYLSINGQEYSYQYVNDKQTFIKN